MLMFGKVPVPFTVLWSAELAMRKSSYRRGEIEMPYG